MSSSARVLQALTGSKGVFVFARDAGLGGAQGRAVGVEVTAGGIVPGDRVISIDGIAVDDVTTLQARDLTRARWKCYWSC
jgi:translation initiation factor IF-2